MTGDDFMEQIRPHGRFLRAQAYSLSRNAHDADDLVQETLLRGWRKFHLFEQGPNLKACLARILTYLFINECRKRRRRLNAVPLHELESYLGDTPLIVPGDSERSELVRIVSGQRPDMPMAQRHRLSAGDVAVIRSWIDGTLPPVPRNS